MLFGNEKNVEENLNIKVEIDNQERDLKSLDPNYFNEV